MGCASSTAEKPSDMSDEEFTSEQRKNKIVNEAVRQSRANEERVNKLLLLGAGSSGKSTLFKQMLTIYCGPPIQAESFTNVIHDNVVESIQILLKHHQKYGTLATEEEIQGATTAIASLAGPTFKAADGTIVTASISGRDSGLSVVPPSGTGSVNRKYDFRSVVKHIQRVWADPAIQMTYEHSNEFQLPLGDSTAYFMKALPRIGAFDYVPSREDVLRCRAPTTGVVETTLAIAGHELKLIDVGGQRSERRKWIQCFDGVTAIVFVAAISEYNQMLYEDGTTNRLTESLNLFEEIANLSYFSQTPILLFLNKRDIFHSKIRSGRFPLNAWFSDYHSPTSDALGISGDVEHAAWWIENEFKKRCKSDHPGVTARIYPHLTCATDKDNIEAVWTVCQDIVFRQNLGSIGLI